MIPWAPFQIFLSFFRISLVSFGGIFGVLPELERDLVATHHWVSHDQFIQAYVTAQFVPGPNMVMCPLLGYQIHGWSGMMAGLVGIYLAPTVIMGLAFHLYHRYRQVALVRRCELSLRPLVVGMLGASALRLWWEQSRILLPAVNASLLLSAALTVGGIYLLRDNKVGPIKMLITFGLIAWGAFQLRGAI